jgi:hypothetical protein
MVIQTSWADLDDDQLVPTRPAASFLGVTTKCLEARRLRGEPPEFVKLGDGPKAPVRYRVGTLRELVRRGLRRSTSDPGTPAADERPAA